MTELVERRLGRLSPDSERVTLLAAVASRLRVRDLDALMGAAAAEALEEAEAAGAVVEHGGELRPSGALVTTVVLGRATAAAIRRAHAQLATVAGAPDDRARHLAGLPDAARHLGEIEAGAAFAARRGAASAEPSSM